jgi:hypothetical protein
VKWGIYFNGLLVTPRVARCIYSLGRFVTSVILINKIEKRIVIVIKIFNKINRHISILTLDLLRTERIMSVALLIPPGAY